MKWVEKLKTFFAIDDKGDPVVQHEQPQPAPPAQQPVQSVPLQEEEVKHEEKKRAFRFPLSLEDENEPPVHEPARMQTEETPVEEANTFALPKHLQQSTVEEQSVETTGIRELLARRQQGRTYARIVRSAGEEFVRPMITEEEQAYFQSYEAPAAARQTADRPIENYKKFVPTDVPSPVYGFQKPRSIETLLRERDGVTSSRIAKKIAEVEQRQQQAAHPKLEERQPRETRAITPPEELAQQLEARHVEAVVTKASTSQNEHEAPVEAMAQHVQKNMPQQEEPKPQQARAEEGEQNVEENTPAVEASTVIDETPVQQPAPTASEPQEAQQLEADEQVAMEQTEQVEATAVDKDAAQSLQLADEPVERVQQPAIQHVVIENSTINIAQMHVEQVPMPQAEATPAAERPTRSRLPFNVLMLKSDKQKLAARKFAAQFQFQVEKEPLVVKQPLTAQEIAQYEADDVVAEQQAVQSTREEQAVAAPFVDEAATYEALQTNEQSTHALYAQQASAVELEQQAVEVQPIDTSATQAVLDVQAIAVEPSKSAQAVALQEAPSVVSVQVTEEAQQEPELEETAGVEQPVESSQQMDVEQPVAALPAIEQPAVAASQAIEEPQVSSAVTEQEAEEQPAVAAPQAVEELQVSSAVAEQVDVEQPVAASPTIDQPAPIAEQQVLQRQEEQLEQAAQDNRTLQVNVPMQAEPAVEVVQEEKSASSNREEQASEQSPSPFQPIVEQPKVIVPYVKPSLDMLKEPEAKLEDREWMDEQGERLVEALSHFQVQAHIESIVQGPAVTQFEITVGQGTKVSKVRNLADDLKLALAAKDIRIDAPIPGKRSIGVEIPNRISRAVRLSEVVNSPSFQDSDSPLEAALGLDLTGQPVTINLHEMPHGLIAGATGSGKSVCVNSILVSLLYKATPQELKLLLIDPKMVELAPFNNIPHLVSPVITDVKAATAALKWAVDEMERRYQLFMHANVRDLSRYNQLVEDSGQYAQKLPYLLIVIDELADLMMMAPADVEDAICRITQKARAAGIHLIVATQRPSVDVITGLIKANIPTRIAFAVSSQIDSRTILGKAGAERLLGRGDMLYEGKGASAPVRLQGTFVTDEEIEDVIQYVRAQGEPEYFFKQEELLKKADMIEDHDELFEEVCRYVFEQGTASTSAIQRRYRIGYARAARLVDILEQQGFVSQQKGSKPRDVYITESDLIDIFG